MTTPTQRPADRKKRKIIAGLVHARTESVGNALASLVEAHGNGDLSAAEVKASARHIITPAMAYATEQAAATEGIDDPSDGVEYTADLVTRVTETAKAQKKGDISAAQAVAYAKQQGGAVWSAYQGERVRLLAGTSDPLLTWAGADDDHTCNDCKDLIGSTRKASEWDVRPGQVMCKDNDRCEFERAARGDVEMSNLTTAQRDALPASAFCGPNRTFPIVDASDVTSAAHLIGKADNPEAVKRCVMAKAKAHGWPLPAAWQANMSSDPDIDWIDAVFAGTADQPRREWFTDEGWAEWEACDGAEFAANNFPKLEKYWRSHMGGGSGRPGDFNECVRTLSKHLDKIKNPRALCSWMHHRVTGAWPGHAAAEHGADDMADVAVEFGLPDAAVDDGEYVIRYGKVWETGEYPDKGFSMTDAEAKAAIEGFTPIPIDLGHPSSASPLDGQLGELQTLELGSDGRSWFGKTRLPRWLDDKLADSGRRVSMTFNRFTKQPRSLSLVSQGRVSDAALFAAFAGARHNSGDMKLIQASHDHMADLGAKCSPMNVEFSKEKKMGFKEKVAAWFAAGTPEEFDHEAEPVKYAIADLEAAYVSAPVGNPEADALRAEVAKLKADRIAADAAAFAESEIRAGRAWPAEQDALVAQFSQAALDDSQYGVVTFGEGQTTTRVERLRQAHSARPAHQVTDEQLDPQQDAAVFANRMDTPNPDAPKAASPERVKELIALTPLGAATLNGRSN